MERRLGRGLGALLSEPEARNGGSESIPVGEIRPNPYQPRSEFDAVGLEELTASIRNHGVLQPIIVRVSGKQLYQLVSGERRWRAAQQAGLASIPAVVRHDVSDDQMLELALVENVQRRDLNPIERAKGFHRLMETLDLTQEAVANRVGLRRATVANHLRLLDLPLKVQEAVSERRVSMGHAKALLGLADEQERVELAVRIVDEDLSVREVERFVRDRTRPAGAPSTPAEAATGSAVDTPTSAKEPWLVELERRLLERFGTKVSVRNGADYRGQIVLEYADRDELERLLELLVPKRRV